MTDTSLVFYLYIFLVSLMLIELVVLMIKNLHVNILCFLVLLISLGNQGNKGLLLIFLIEGKYKVLIDGTAEIL